MSTTHRNEQQRDCAAAYDWITAGGLNTLADCLALDLEHELGILARETSPEYAATVRAGIDDAFELIKAELAEG